ncbi:MAG: PEGA domain-containing protein [bacterium]|nr:PEGA domain-containing protein [bacterium]
MKKKTLLFVLFAACLLLLSSSAWAAKKTVAVMNFANYGGGGMKYLSNAIPESISSALAESGDIRVIERRQLGKLVDEIALEQSGLVDTGDVSRAGQMAKSDYLILGSISGNPGNITVTMKVVEVASGKILVGKVIRAPLANVFDKANQAARSMAAVISGKGIGKISVYSSPSGAEVHIDGILVGKSPVIGYKVTMGSHEVVVSKDGYIEYDTSVSVSKNEHEKLKPVLDEAKYLNRFFMGIGGAFLVPIYSELNNSPYFYFVLGQTYGWITMSAEIGYSYIKHPQTYLFFGDTYKTIDRHYNFFTVHGHITFAPFRFKYVSPYAGGIIGWTYLSDRRYKEGGDDAMFADNVEIIRNSHRVALGAVGGVTIMPYAKVSIFIDTRFYVHVPKVSREVYYKPNLSSALTTTREDYFLTAWTIGGGLKYHFN